MEASAANPGPPQAAPWWRGAVFYRVDLRSFADSSGDGVGDLDGARQRLGYLELLGVDALWLTALVAAPITEPGQGRAVDPVLGEVASFDRLVEEAHAAGLRVALDVAVQHSALGSPGDQRRERCAEAVRFWLDRDVDGLRVAAAPGVVEPAGAAVREVLRELRPIVADYPGRGTGVLIDESSFADGPHEVDWDIGIDLRLGDTPFDAEAMQDTITRILETARTAGVEPVWTATSRSQVQPVARFGGGAEGRAKARALALVVLGLPGIVGLDNGEELALPHGAPRGLGADVPVRGPMPWEGAEPPFGFSAAPGGWWPMTDEWAPFTVEAQLEDPDSTLSLHRKALELRAEHPALRGDQIDWFGAPSGCFAFRRSPGGLACALNASAASVSLPPGEVLLASGPLDGERLPPNTSVWLV